MEEIDNLEQKYQVVSIDDVMKYYFDGYRKVNQNVTAYEYLLDPVRKKVAFRLFIKKD